MINTPHSPSNPRIRKGLHKLQQQIERRFPGATFEVVGGEDPEGVYLNVTVDVDDLDEVLDQELLNSLFDIQVEQGLPVYVLPLWPAQRIEAELARRNTTYDVLALPKFL